MTLLIVTGSILGCFLIGVLSGVIAVRVESRKYTARDVEIYSPGLGVTFQIFLFFWPLALLVTLLTPVAWLLQVLLAGIDKWTVQTAKDIAGKNKRND